ncbi:nucleoside recognition domain-containing protein [Bacillaceae bacterium]
MVTKETWRKGFKSGLRTTWLLGKVIFPITLIISLLEHTPVIDWLVFLFEPLMQWFGLPGEAAISLVLANLLNLYAGIAAVLTLDLTVKDVFILAVMMSFSHNLLIETAIARQIGVKAWVLVSVRLGLAFVSALVLHWFWRGGDEKAVYALQPAAKEELAGWGAILWHGVETAVFGIIELAALVIPLMVVIQLLKDVQAIHFLSRSLIPFTRILGVSNNTATTLMAGIIFGIAYGAGVIIQTAKEENLAKRDLYLISIFLVSCHAVIEDTLLFVPLGIDVLPLLLLRLVTAFLLTALTAQIWNRVGMRHEWQKGRSFSA